VAMVAAAEHFTALSSDMYLSNPDFLKGVDPDLLLIWQWHFIEEIEHKNLCFDVFEAIGGHYVQRVIGFFLSTLFSFTIFFNYFMHMMMVDKLYLKSGFYREFLSFFFGKQGILRLLMIPFLSFLKPSFHPSQYRSEEQKELVKFQLLKIEALLRITASSP
jgi:predicted metal-dependent hydrolase